MTNPRYTKRKFYGKWLYKITVHEPGVSIFRQKALEDVIEFCDSNYSSSGAIHSTKDKAYNHRINIKLIGEFLLKWQPNEWTKRIESDSMDIYTNNKELYDLAKIQLDNVITSLFEPSLESVNDLVDPANIVVKKYPHNKFRYKVYLLPHKIVNDITVRNNYIDWIEGQSPRILISQAVKKWFVKTIWNWDRRYVLVEDHQTLLMLKLRNPDVIGRVYNYILTDK